MQSSLARDAVSEKASFRPLSSLDCFGPILYRAPLSICVQTCILCCTLYWWIEMESKVWRRRTIRPSKNSFNVASFFAVKYTGLFVCIFSAFSDKVSFPFSQRWKSLRSLSGPRREIKVALLQMPSSPWAFLQTFPPRPSTKTWSNIKY